VGSESSRSIESIDFFLAESSRSTESTKVESIDRVGRFSVELSRFVRLDRFQGLTYTRSLHRRSPLEAASVNNVTYSFIANCQTTVVNKNETTRGSKVGLYESQYILRYNILTVKLQSVIREKRSGSCLL